MAAHLKVESPCCAACQQLADRRLVRAGLRDFWCQVAIVALLTLWWRTSSLSGDRYFAMDCVEQTVLP